MSNHMSAGSVFVGFGMAVVVVAVLVAAIGTGGLAYMSVNPDAVQLVAGCALCSAVLIGVGIILITQGLTRMIHRECDATLDHPKEHLLRVRDGETQLPAYRSLPASLR